MHKTTIKLSTHISNATGSKPFSQVSSSVVTMTQTWERKHDRHMPCGRVLSLSITYWKHSNTAVMKVWSRATHHLVSYGFTDLETSKGNKTGQTFWFQKALMKGVHYFLISASLASFPGPLERDLRMEPPATPTPPTPVTVFLQLTFAFQDGGGCGRSTGRFASTGFSLPYIP